jgi:hypothetical protein
MIPVAVITAGLIASSEGGSLNNASLEQLQHSNAADIAATLHHHHPEHEHPAASSHAIVRGRERTTMPAAELPTTTALHGSQHRNVPSAIQLGVCSQHSSKEE